ncbi:LexA family protein [Providencia rettgeri]|uniref:LexA family protein n=1 Tax=Providencia rettgeri TaxID=587 RepID=UPI002AB3C3ED|nr:helix-turn-helix domain-containing protein [Providencia stuartii]
MKIDENFKNRIQLARQALGLTQGDLADKVGVVRRQIAAYEAGDSKPRVNVLNNLAAALGTSPNWLASGEGTSPNIGNIRTTVTLPLIPVITSVQAELLFMDDDSENIIGYDYIAAPQNASSDSFAIAIESESMQSATGISFTTGSVVIFDPMIEATNGDFVLCRLSDYKSAIFKQYIIDQGNEYLLSLNDSYPAIRITNDCFIIGVAVESRLDLSLRAGFGFPSGLQKTINKLHENNESLTPEQSSNKKNTNNTELAQRLDRIESMLNKLINKDV